MRKRQSLVARLIALALGRALRAVRSPHTARIVSVPLSSFSNALELFLKTGDFFVGKFFKIDKFISSAFQRSNYFVEFQMSRFGIAVLRILNEKDHQESNNCRSGINNELPGIRIMKRRTGQSPNDDDENSAGKSPGATEYPRRAPCKDPKSIAYYAKEISRFCLLLNFLLGVDCHNCKRPRTT
jgi:hypothetical protein